MYKSRLVSLIDEQRWGGEGAAAPWARDESNLSARLGVNENGHLLSPATRGERAAAMADYSNVAPPSSNAPAGMNDAFKDALQRARQVLRLGLFFPHHFNVGFVNSGF